MTKPTLAWALGLSFLIYGCSPGGLVPGGGTGSGGLASSGGAQSGGGGQTGSGGVPAGGSGGTSDSGGAAPSGGSGGSSSGGTSGSTGGTAAVTFSLTSPAFEAAEGCTPDSLGPCALFPDENVSYMDNANVSPELSWTDLPPGTESLALVLFDVTYGQAHWVLWNIPADTVTLAADVPQDTKLLVTPAGSEQANANFADTSTDGYFGPHVPCNVFEFQLFALTLPTFTPEDPDSAVLVHIELQELGDPVLGIATLRGRSDDYDVTCE